MLGYHRRIRSLIPVKELGKYDKVPMQEEVYIEEEEEAEMKTYDGVDGGDKARSRQLMLVYLVFLAEAYVIASIVQEDHANLSAQHHGL
jgi:hypothetical protein